MNKNFSFRYKAQFKRRYWYEMHSTRYKASLLQSHVLKRAFLLLPASYLLMPNIKNEWIIVAFTPHIHSQITGLESFKTATKSLKLGKV
ncbi:hypothetical protein H6H03_22055 [Nostoc paludosum FACHB-159]|uniref:Uncharacterized protein n=1 Tax=Nostoc paludosum FACHB-159 TaxID=2692908 RepID=A0ABR8KCT5_9NOSO|nr:hypothetical protein [Nostoc paludosum FACHB-159]